MSKRAPTLCRSCKTATVNRSGYCDECVNPVAVSRKKKKGDPFYWNTNWKLVRDKKKSMNPLCEKCLKFGRLIPVDVVDHIVERKDGGKPYALENLESLCSRCHAKKTAISKKEREGVFESPPAPTATPFGKKTFTLNTKIS